MNSDRPLSAPAAPYPKRRVARGGILILGGGFAGSHLARSLGEATVVNPAPLRAMAPETDLVLGSAVSVDPDRRVAEVDAVLGRISIAYAELVVVLGSMGGTPPVPGLPLDGWGRIRVDHGLRVAGTSHIWALGDCAAVPEAVPGKTEPATCEHALRQVRQLARNLGGAPRVDRTEKP